jgi:hypothetical protein
MCIGGGSSSKLPPVPPTPPTLADSQVQNARSAAQRSVADSGLAATTLNVNLGGTGAGNRKLAGAT